MGPTKMLAFAGAATALITTTAAIAADFPAAMPPPQMVRTPAETTGWYLRGDIGVGNQHFKSFDFTQTNGNNWPATWRNWLRRNIDEAPRRSGALRVHQGGKSGSTVDRTRAAFDEVLSVLDGDNQDPYGDVIDTQARVM